MKKVLIIMSVFMTMSSFALDLKNSSQIGSEIVQPQKKADKDESKVSDLVKREECKKNANADETECEKLKNQDNGKD
jgi:hypothetical protein